MSVRLGLVGTVVVRCTVQVRYGTRYVRYGIVRYGTVMYRPTVRRDVGTVRGRYRYGRQVKVQVCLTVVQWCTGLVSDKVRYGGSVRLFVRY